LDAEAFHFFHEPSTGFWIREVDGDNMASRAVSSIQVGRKFRHLVLAASRQDQMHSSTGQLDSELRANPG
jgi:hypothetical protein